MTAARIPSNNWKVKAQLEQQQKSLEEFQDAARKQGFGSSVYDP